MNKILKNIALPGIISAGEVYILISEKETGLDAGTVDEMYVLTSDQDILPALEMELRLFLGSCYELRRFIRWAEVLEDCYEFRFACYDKRNKKEVGYSFFLHRLATFYERLACTRTLIIDYN